MALDAHTGTCMTAGINLAKNLSYGNLVIRVPSNSQSDFRTAVLANLPLFPELYHLQQWED